MSRLPVTMLLISVACSSPPVDSTVPLVDRFSTAVVDGATTLGNQSPLAWRFDGASHDFKAGAGVRDLRVVNGRLTGRATDGVPIVHVERTSGFDEEDTLHAVEVTLRASGGANFSILVRGDGKD